MEAEIKTRVRKDHQDTERVTGNMVWAEFIHTTSRPVAGIPDPQLHAHAVVFNCTYDQEEQRFKAGYFREIKRDAPYFQAAFRVRLAGKLQELGVGIERKRDDFEIAGMPADVLKRFSRRTTLIEKEAAKRGITDPDRRAELGAKTREKKESSLGWDVLRREWDSRLSERERQAMAAIHHREQVVARPERGEVAAVDYAVAHSYVREAVVPERKLATEALKRGIGAVTVEGVNRELAKRPLIRSNVSGRPMATTQEMLALESRLIDFARDGRGRCRPLGDPGRPCSRSWFNEGQKVAVRHVLSSRDRVLIVRGAAGTGKTTLEQEIGEALAEAEVPVVAMAQSVKASREVLRNEAGFTSADTVARFLVDEKMQQAAKGGVIIVDEASQLGTRDMMAVFKVAQAQDARVLLVGDRRQHRSVAAGEPLKLLEDMAGLKVAEVTEILRQQGDYKHAAKAFSEGRIEEGLDELDKLGWIREVDDAGRYRMLADAYLAAVSEKKRNGEYKTSVVVSPTHAELEKISQAIRLGLKEQGRLGKDRAFTAWVPMHLTEAEKSDPTQYDDGFMVEFHQNARGGYTRGSRLIVGEGVKPPIDLAARFEVFRPAEIALAVGDRIRVTAGGKTKDGHRLSNGSLLTIQGFTRGGGIVVDHGWVIDRDFGHLAYGYATTSHSSQGVTVDKVFVGISSESLPATSQRTAYVALTRAKEQALILTDDCKELFKAFGRTDDPLSAMEISEDMQQQPRVRGWLKKQLAMVGASVAFGQERDSRQVSIGRDGI